MAQKEIVTQSELQGVVDELNVLSNNLDIHAAESLTKAHGMNVQSSTYFDSAGNTLASQSLRITVDDTVLFVPAQTPSPDPGPSSTTPAVDTSGVSSGTPGSSSLATTFGETQESIATGVNGLLVNHAGERAEEVHGNLSVLAQDIRDNANHLVGRRVIIFSYNGTQYRMVADTEPAGPTQPPRIASGAASCPVVAALGPSGRTQTTACVINDFAGEGQAAGTYYVECSVTGGTFPINYQWQVSTDGQASWINMVADTEYLSTQDFELTVPSAVNPPTGTINSIASAARAEIVLGHGGSSSQSPAFHIRCVFSNTGIEDGGSVSTASMAINMKDKTSCSLWTAAYYAEAIPASSVLDMVGYRTRFQMDRWLGDAVWSGYTVFSRPFTKHVSKRNVLGGLIVKAIVEPCHRAVEWRIGKKSFSFSALMLAVIAQGIFLATYFVKYKECQKVKEQLTGRKLLSVYRDVIRDARRSRDK